jgi:hypothetical protein
VKVERILRGFLVLATLCACHIAAAQVVLVTAQEAEASRRAAPQFTPKSLPAPDAPRIVLEMPDISRPLASPVTIQLQFSPTPPAVVRPETFRVLYGILRLDITDRITGATKVTGRGLAVREAILPSGSHALLVELEDSAGRQGRQQFEFVVK